MVDEKFPSPEPSVVLEFKIVGIFDVLQQTPLCVTALPPSKLTLPPEIAEDVVMFVTEVVVIVAADNGVVLNVTSFP